MMEKRLWFKVIAPSALLLFIALISPYIVPFDPYVQDLNGALQSPNMEHWLGTDRYGRDVLSRVLVGGQVTLFSSLFLVFIIASVGSIIGIVCGYCGGKLDVVLMRCSDLFLAFPEMVFAVAVAGVLGGGIMNAIMALALIAWPKYARLARSQVLAVRNNTYVEAAVVCGATTKDVIVRHLLPNIAGPIIVTAFLDIGTIIMELAGLSFLGLGAMPPTAEWGAMMNNGRSMIQTAPWMVLAPGVAIFISVAVFNSLGDKLRDILDIR